jgi:hypothetical protein
VRLHQAVDRLANRSAFRFGARGGRTLGEIRKAKTLLIPVAYGAPLHISSERHYIFIMIVATSSALLTAIALIDPGYRSIALTQAVSLLAGAY